jgi:hypothetical protein
MHSIIDKNAPEPIYSQLQNQVETSIRTRKLLPSDCPNAFYSFIRAFSFSQSPREMSRLFVKDYFMDRDTMDSMDVMDTNGHVFMDRMDTCSR